MADKIKCPNCGVEFEITEAIEQQFQEKYKHQTEEQFQKQMQLLSKKEKEIQEQQIKLDELLQQKEKEIQKKIRTETESSLKKQYDLELKDLKNQIDEQNKEIEEKNKAELDLRKKIREVEKMKKEAELEIQKKLDQEKGQLKETLLKEFQEQHDLKDQEKDKTIRDLTRALEDAKRKAEQGSMQTQGEVLELDLEQKLKEWFPGDEIESVSTGQRGADVIHKVFDEYHHYCGTIYWEAKSAKNWSDRWIEKLKDDQREISADIGIILTTELPKDIENFGHRDKVWITDRRSAWGLATALRFQIIRVHFANQSTEGKNEKMDLIFQYLSGHEFRQKIEAIIESFSNLNQQLEKEKRAYARIWNQREKQIRRIIDSTAGMYGDLKALVGASLPDIQMLELASDDQIKQLSDK